MCQTLEKVVEGWRRHEKEKSEGVRRLQEEKEAAESTQQKQREVCVYSHIQTKIVMAN